MASPLEGLCLFNGLTSVIAVWILVEEQGPERSGHVAAWDARSQQFLIHGGSDTEFRPDLWAYDVESGPWDQKLQLNSAPSKRGDHVAVWDPSELALWIHGGFDGATLFNDLWRYSIRTIAGPSWQMELGWLHVLEAVMSLCGTQAVLPSCVMVASVGLFGTTCGCSTLEIRQVLGFELSQLRTDGLQRERIT